MKCYKLQSGRNAFITLSICVAGALPAARALADDEVPFNELSAQWWEVALSLPASANPLNDPTGDNCMLGQRGEVWFLHGTFSGGSAARKCSVPEDKPLFFPVVNFVNVNTPGICGQDPGQQFDVRTLRSQIAPFIDNAQNLYVKVDGSLVNDLERVKSVPFALALPSQNLFVAAYACGNSTDPPAGVYSPAVDDGYYVMLKPLKAGAHTLHIHGELPTASTIVDVTYTLKVVPVRRK